ncbi:hypothetical protein [Streptomyces sp. Midd1]|uniref:hypothetical protein n=1 Tax=Streptomyces sp. Midd3 TaxID=3161191 RepID=UPI0034DAC91E
MSDVEQLAAEFTETGSVDAHSIGMIRVGLDRMEAYGTVLALQEELAMRSREVGRLVEFLGNNQDPGALARVQGRLNHQMAEVLDLADNATA